MEKKYYFERPENIIRFQVKKKNALYKNRNVSFMFISILKGFIEIYRFKKRRYKIN